MNDLTRNIVLWVVIAVVLLAVFSNFGPRQGETGEITYSAFLNEVKAGSVAAVEFKGEQLIVKRRDNTTARVFNISVGGIGLLVKETVELGSLISLNLTPPGGGATRTILACVVHVVARAQNERLLGCNFIHELSEADLRVLL